MHSFENSINFVLLFKTWILLIKKWNYELPIISYCVVRYADLKYKKMKMFKNSNSK